MILRAQIHNLAFKWDTDDRLHIAVTCPDVQAPRKRKKKPMPSSNDTPLEPLTRRELEVLPHLVEGCTNEEIGERLAISVHTAKYHITNVVQKLSSDGNRIRAVVRAVRLGLA